MNTLQAKRRDKLGRPINNRIKQERAKEKAQDLIREYYTHNALSVWLIAAATLAGQVGIMPLLIDTHTYTHLIGSFTGSIVLRWALICAVYVVIPIANLYDPLLRVTAGYAMVLKPGSNRINEEVESILSKQWLARIIEKACKVGKSDFDRTFRTLFLTFVVVDVALCLFEAIVLNVVQLHSYF